MMTDISMSYRRACMPEFKFDLDESLKRRWKYSETRDYPEKKKKKTITYYSRVYYYIKFLK